MIKGNKIKFGYGTILVSHNRFDNSITFQGAKPRSKSALICGQIANSYEAEPVGKKIVITLDAHIYKQFNELLRLAEWRKECRVFEFCDYVFDFSKFNQKSVDVCRSHAYEAMLDLVTMAC